MTGKNSTGRVEVTITVEIWWGKFSYFFEKLSNEEKSFHNIEFLGKKTDWDSWSKKFVLHGKWKGYKKLLVSNRSTSGVDKIPTQEEYENLMEGDIDIDKKS